MHRFCLVFFHFRWMEYQRGRKGQKEDFSRHVARNLDIPDERFHTQIHRWTDIGNSYQGLTEEFGAVARCTNIREDARQREVEFWRSESPPRTRGFSIVSAINSSNNSLPAAGGECFSLWWRVSPCLKLHKTPKPTEAPRKKLAADGSTSKN